MDSVWIIKPQDYWLLPWRSQYSHREGLLGQPAQCMHQKSSLTYLKLGCFSIKALKFLLFKCSAQSVDVQPLCSNPCRVILTCPLYVNTTISMVITHLYAAFCDSGRHNLWLLGVRGRPRPPDHLQRQQQRRSHQSSIFRHPQRREVSRNFQSQQR